MNVGDKVRVTSGEFQGKVGKIKVRHFNAVPGEMKKIRAGAVIDIRNDETLYSVRLEGEKEIIYFPQSSLEPVID